jgi:hypothetical protein
MQRWLYQLLVCLALVFLLTMPAMVAAQGPKVYADGTGTSGTGEGPLGSPNNPVRVGSPPDFSEAVSLLPDKTGTIVYIFKGGWCEVPVQSGKVGDLTSCSQSAPPSAGCRSASALVGVVLVLRLRRSTRKVKTGNE